MSRKLPGTGSAKCPGSTRTPGDGEVKAPESLDDIRTVYDEVTDKGAASTRTVWRHREQVRSNPGPPGTP